MKKVMLSFAVVVLLTGCANRKEFCEKPPLLHPVTVCEDCSWQEL